MEFTIRECEAILKTLPIGYYCGGRIDVTLDKNEPTSYFRHDNNSIVISYPIISKGLEAVTDEAWKETAVRSMLYHEVSHAILTPETFMHEDDSERILEVLNIFEDERIETLLNSYYMDVNFKQNLFNICGEKPSVDKADPISIFYALVRYRYGDPKLLERVKDIITKYSKLNRLSERSTIYDYRYEIIRLYYDIVGKINHEDNPFSNMEQDSEELGNLLPNVPDKLPTSSSSNKQNDEENGQSSEENESIEEIEIDENEDIEGMKIDEKIRGRIRQALKGTYEGVEEEQKTELIKAEKTIETIISNFNKKNNGGNGYNSYSGIFNPRAVARDDYKYFDRIATINGNNSFGTCHLNLIIDRSGSFCSNEPIVNSLLDVMTKIENKYPNFSMDVSFINDDFYTCKTKRERHIHCCGANDIPDNWKKLMEKLQKQNSYNYTIILFDGDAVCDRGNDMIRYKVFKQLDMPNTTLITDRDNVRYMQNKNKFTKAKVIITENYTDELIKNIVIALTRMFS
ncbi:MAG: hypothetical protein LIR50_21910 [Bacillota bacterium]|nr:hypothetical protein [Bacillota bacterium]